MHDGQSTVLRKLRRGGSLYLFLLPALCYYLLFCYVPMYGLQIAFKNFMPAKGIAGSAWVGLANFQRFVSSPSFATIVGNTLSISLTTLILGFPAPLLFALALNEIHHKRFKSVVQTVSYAPHFISVVVMVSMITMFLNEDYGVITRLAMAFGGEQANYLTHADKFVAIYVLSGIWQGLGWGSIIYLAALTGIDPCLHEAAMIDGASCWQRIWHINLSGIMPTIVTMLILRCGNLMSVGYEKAFLMQNPLNLPASEIISTYVYKYGLQQFQYSFSSAVGLFNNIINCILLVMVNTAARKMGESGIF